MDNGTLPLPERNLLLLPGKLVIAFHPDFLRLPFHDLSHAKLADLVRRDVDVVEFVAVAPLNGDLGHIAFVEHAHDQVHCIVVGSLVDVRLHPEQFLQFIIDDVLERSILIHLGVMDLHVCHIHRNPCQGGIDDGTLIAGGQSQPVGMV